MFYNTTSNARPLKHGCTKTPSHVFNDNGLGMSWIHLGQLVQVAEFHHEVLKNRLRILTFRLGFFKQLDPQFLVLKEPAIRPKNLLPKNQLPPATRNDAAWWTGVRETHLFGQKIGFIGCQWRFPILKFASGNFQAIRQSGKNHLL